jgi:hypothetical protein
MKLIELGFEFVMTDKEALDFSEKLNNPACYLHRSPIHPKACMGGRRLAWSRIPALGQSNFSGFISLLMLYPYLILLL